MSNLDAIIAVTITVLFSAAVFASITYSWRHVGMMWNWVEANRAWSRPDYRPKGQNRFATNLGIALRVVWMAALLGCGIYTVVKVHNMASTVEMIHNQNMLIYDTQVALTRDCFAATHK
jgi:hypothetical protein